MRAGGRRRARRRTVTAAAAVVLAGSTGALAMTGLPGTGDDTSPAKPAPAYERQVDEPRISHVGFGTYDGAKWGVNVQVWPAPRDKTEAARQLKAMNSWGLTPVTTGGPSDLVGRTSYFVLRGYGDTGTRLVTFDTVARLPRPKGTEIDAIPQPLTERGAPSAWSSAPSPRPRSRSPATGRTAARPSPTSRPTTRPSTTSRP